MLITHENGPWYVESGMMVNRYNEKGRTNRPAVFLDKEAGTLLKAGDVDMVRAYAATSIDAYMKHGAKDISESMTVVSFDYYSCLNIDDICSVINYMNNSIGKEAMQDILQDLLSMDDSQLRAKIKQLQRFGF